MRLRRLEIIIIGVTIAFVCFMGGFFTGKSSGAVSVASVSAQNGEIQTVSTSNQIQNEQTHSNPQSPPAETPQELTSDEDIQTAHGSTSSENTSAPIGQPTGGDGKININLATQSELTDLPGIGGVLASRIVDYRRMHGNFTRIEDIRNVSGIGEKRYEAIEDKITVG